MTIKLSNENATTRKLTSDIEHLRHVTKVIDIVFASIMAVGIVFITVVCPIMVLH